MRIIITGSSGMVGEGVMLVCLSHPKVSKVLIINRKPSGFTHPKLTELIVQDFSKIAQFASSLKEYDACFFCAGVSSVGMTEDTFTKATYDFVVPFAKFLSEINPNMVFNYVSGTGTDSTEQGKVMWARVKGKTENALQKLPFKGQYNFRPGFMKPVKGQQNLKGIYRVISPLYPIFATFTPNFTSTLEDLGLAMIDSVELGYKQPNIEVRDIKKMAK